MADPEILAKMGVFRHKVTDGHAPGLSGKGLCAYVGAGIGSDHECTTVEEAWEKLRTGMRIMIREGSAAKNLDSLLPVVHEHNSRNCFFVTDDTDPRDLVAKGHISRLVKIAVSKGLDPVRAIQMVTINPASYFRLTGLGAVLPGYVADLLVMEDLREFKVSRVYHAGRLVASDGELLVPTVLKGDTRTAGSMNVDWSKVTDLSISGQGNSVNIIQVVPDQIVTRRVIAQATMRDGKVVADTDRDILKIAVIERHNGTGAFAVGLIKGFGLKRGALASTVAHDSHNIVVVGADDEDMLAAAKSVASLGGGMVAVSSGEVLAQVPLPIAGLMSDCPIGEVVDGLEKVVHAAHDLGCTLEGPFATLSFMALTPIPELKITDQGLFDSVNFRFVPLFET
jgi:adenine deaminase